MKRSDDDTWDLATSVGVTATMVAAARAEASRKANPIVSDPLAAPLVCAAGVELFARVASGDLAFSDIGSGWIPELFGVRAKYFDSFFPAALSAGIQQAVIVASGLDSRAYRLKWRADVVVYEIDQPGVIEFKKSVLSRLGVKPTTELRTVGADLRHDWPRTLQQAGFDRSKPTAWMLEGLMIGYLPTEAQNRMLDQMTTLSAPSSQMIADYLPANSRSVGSWLLATAKEWKQRGFDVDFGNLTFPHERNDVEAYLQARGWHVTSRRLADLVIAVGAHADYLDTGPDGHGAIHYFTAIRNDRSC